MTMDLKMNPFAKVFPSIEAAEIYCNIVKQAGKTVFLHELTQFENGDHDLKDLFIKVIIEKVFNFTMFKVPFGSEPQLLDIHDLSSENVGCKCIDNLQHVLFERLLLEDPSKYLIKAKHNNFNSNSHVVEKRCLHYLFECYRRLVVKKQEHKNVEDMLDKVMGFVINNSATALKQPEVYEDQNIYEQVISLANYECEEDIKAFLLAVTDDINKEEGPDGLFTAFTPILAIVKERLSKSNSILLYDKQSLHVLYIFACVPSLAEILLKQGKRKELTSIGRSFSDSPLGAAFNISILPNSPFDQYEFFDNPLDVNIKILENQLWSATEALQERLFEILKVMLKTSKNETLTWLGECLDKNVPRGRLSALDTLSLDTLNCVSDGFMLNLCAVLLRLSQRFTSSIDNPQLLSIDPTYPAAKVDGKNSMHMNSLASETCLLPSEQDYQRPYAGHFSFTTECFFLTHRALNLGTAVVQDRAQRLYQEIGMMQARLRPDARSDAMELAMTKYLSLRCALIVPNNMALHGSFVVATCHWLVQVVLNTDLTSDSQHFSPEISREVSFPLPASGPPTLRCVPELLLENVAHYLVAAKRFEIANIVVEELKQLSTVLTCLLVFMSGSGQARNPHLRAHLAECLECLVPQNNTISTLSTFAREQLFKTHPHSGQIVQSLLDVFVGIEMTGQSVSFEQKFNYRRPMYSVMEYLWSIDEQKQSFKCLAAEAEANMEAVNPPLFLKFLNLLMNDAVFLLDEALNNMASLRTMVLARDAGEWDSMPPQERQRTESSFVHVGMTARFDNILGSKTIECLVYLSSEIKTIFCHPTMVDRIAAMLNYFLLHLVGPKKKNFKVKDQLKEYMFDPASIVENICRIYIQLSEFEAFTAAVSHDGRSYSPQLFSFAEHVLVHIGRGQYVPDLKDFAVRVSKAAKLQHQEDELLAEVPDDFLDPIMSTLMTDPVRLPSSKQIVDRSTIARHLLSDQSDPFNREPLTMDMLQPATELKQRMDKWFAEKSATSSSSIE